LFQGAALLLSNRWFTIAVIAHEDLDTMKLLVKFNLLLIIVFGLGMALITINVPTAAYQSVIFRTPWCRFPPK
jgi:hypothetical protein